MTEESREHRLVQSLVHELRNPLFALSSTLEAYEALAEHDASHAEYLEAIRGQVKRMTAILATLAQWARPIDLRREMRSHAELVRRAIAEVEPLARTRGVRIEETLDGERTSSIDGDKVTQAIASILEVAIERSSSRGRVVHVVLRDALTISDTGGLVQAEDLARIFEPMYKPHALAMAQRIVTAHDGTITASNAGDGLVIAVSV